VNNSCFFWIQAHALIEHASSKVAKLLRPSRVWDHTTYTMRQYEFGMALVVCLQASLLLYGLLVDQGDWRVVALLLSLEPLFWLQAYVRSISTFLSMAEDLTQARRHYLRYSFL
jgi:hypothetical protein